MDESPKQSIHIYFGLGIAEIIIATRSGLLDFVSWPSRNRLTNRNLKLRSQTMRERDVLLASIDAPVTMGAITCQIVCTCGRPTMSLLGHISLRCTNKTRTDANWILSHKLRMFNPHGPITAKFQFHKSTLLIPVTLISEQWKVIYSKFTPQGAHNCESTGPLEM